jgi:lysozyme
VATTIYGPDISHFQAGLDLQQVKDEGFDFVWAKVSEGDYYRDASWPQFRDAARAAGLLLAGYHYVRYDCDPGDQADLFVAHLGDKSIPAMLDFEANSGDIGSFWAVLHAIEDRGVRVALSYIPRWYWMQIGQPYIGDVPGLIQSSYVGGTGYASALYPGDASGYWGGFGGRNVDILQFTDQALIGGMSVDANAFRGSRDDLTTLLGGVPVPTPNAIDDYAAMPEHAWLGNRLTDGEIATPDGVGRRAEFDHGQVYWHPDTGAYGIPAELFDKFGELHWEAGPLGYPVSDHTVLPDGLVQAYQGGSLYRKTGSDNTYWVHGAIRDQWARLGYEKGALGWPTSDEIPWDTKTYQEYENGRVWWVPTQTLALLTKDGVDTPLHEPAQS